jgi:hypothetical protein
VNLIVAPESTCGPWLTRLLREGPALVLAPWALPQPPAALARLVPGRLAQAWQRRQLPAPSISGPGPGVRFLPGWPLVEGAARLFARGRTDRQMTARFALREAVDLLAARLLAAAPDGITAVVAPTCAARHTFAAARQRRLPTTLVQDLPLIRALHEDLDRAAAVHPDCAFLRRYRASHRVVARQEAEWVLADSIYARGAYARQALRERTTARVLDLVPPTPRPGGDGRPVPPKGPLRILLAGLATGRSGVIEALALLTAFPEATLLVNVPRLPGGAAEGLEPADLLQRDRVRPATPAERQELKGVDLVIAPAWCEGYPAEVPAAAARGVKLVATRRAAGAVAPDAEIAPGDVDGLIAAVGLLRTGACPARSFVP